MNRSLIACLLFLSSAANTVASDELYFVSFAIFPAGQAKHCAFMQARDPDSEKAITGFRPSTVFMKAACSHFRATWQTDLTPNITPDYEIAVWRRESPDVPTFMQMANM